MKAALIFNGHTQDTIDAIDEETFNSITVMYGDGILGNHGLLNTLGMLVNGVFNYIRSPNTPPYSLKSILNQAYGYIHEDMEVTPSDSLKMFISQAKGYSESRF